MRRVWRWGAAASVAAVLPVVFGGPASGAPSDGPDAAAAVRLQAAIRAATGIGDGGTGVSADDDVAVAIDAGAVAAVGAGHTCAIAVFADVWCWGANDSGQLGDGSTADSADPVLITASGPLAGLSATFVTAGRAHTCALVAVRDPDDGGDLWCWGDNADGQLGDGSTTSRTRPVPAVEGVVDVATGADHTCVVDEDAAVSCWGRNDVGQLGTGSAGGPEPAPQPVTGLPDVTAIAAGDESTCAIDEDGAVWCWGSDADGQLGDGGGAGAPSATPVQVVMTDVDGEFVGLDGGRGHMCGVAGAGEAWCWGDDGAGQLGNGASAGDPSQPAAVAGSASFVSISAGGDSTCAVADTAVVRCWGANGSGQLGVGDRADRAAPAPVDQSAVRTSPIFEYVYGSADKLLIGVTVGGERTCALDVNPNYYCWGDNGGGRLGTGTAGDALVATPTSLVPGAATGVRLQPGDERLGVRWRAPADPGAAPPREYAAIALTGTGIEAVLDSHGCATSRPACTIEELTNGFRYDVFVGLATRGGVSWTAAAAGTPVAPAPGGGGGLPVTGPHTLPLMAAGLTMVAAGVLCLAGGRRRRPA